MQPVNTLRLPAQAAEDLLIWLRMQTLAPRAASGPRSQHASARPIVASEPMRELLTLAERAAASDAKVLVTGESGAGKDIVARHVHEHSTRRLAEFVPVNCAGVTETLLESELFGHVKGSFTGAYRDKIGKLRLAHGGTLFLDEVGEMSLRMQALLLRFLENGEIRRWDRMRRADGGRPRDRGHEQNLADMVSWRVPRGSLYRLRVIHLHVPSLRERATDIRPLAMLLRALRPAGHADRRGVADNGTLQVAGQRPRVTERRRADRMAVGVSG
jgi:DNA-binding NtrC family response regulator